MYISNSSGPCLISNMYDNGNVCASVPVCVCVCEHACDPSDQSASCITLVTCKPHPAAGHTRGERPNEASGFQRSCELVPVYWKLSPISFNLCKKASEGPHANVSHQVIYRSQKAASRESQRKCARRPVKSLRDQIGWQISQNWCHPVKDDQKKKNTSERKSRAKDRSEQFFFSRLSRSPQLSACLPWELAHHLACVRKIICHSVGEMSGRMCCSNRWVVKMKCYYIWIFFRSTYDTRAPLKKFCFLTLAAASSSSFTLAFSHFYPLVSLLPSLSFPH